MVLSLNGKEEMTGNNMFGTRIVREDGMKKKMIDKLLIPVVQRKWEEARQNFVVFRSRFQSLKDEMYVYLLKTVELLLHQQTAEQELVFVLPPIQLKPEYEVYKLIFGIPKIYDKEKLEHIRKLLKKENITFDKIKSQL